MSSVSGSIGEATPFICENSDSTFWVLECRDESHDECCKCSALTCLSVFQNCFKGKRQNECCKCSALTCLSVFQNCFKGKRQTSSPQNPRIIEKVRIDLTKLDLKVKEGEALQETGLENSTFYTSGDGAFIVESLEEETGASSKSCCERLAAACSSLFQCCFKKTLAQDS